MMFTLQVYSSYSEKPQLFHGSYIVVSHTNSPAQHYTFINMYISFHEVTLFPFDAV